MLHFKADLIHFHFPRPSGNYSRVVVLNETEKCARPFSPTNCAGRAAGTIFNHMHELLNGFPRQIVSIPASSGKNLIFLTDFICLPPLIVIFSCIPFFHRTTPCGWYLCTRAKSRPRGRPCRARCRGRWRRSRGHGRCFWRSAPTSTRCPTRPAWASWSCATRTSSCPRATRVCTGARSSSWTTSTRSITSWGWVTEFYRFSLIIIFIKLLALNIRGWQ